jgi:fatty-acyl-CoA synthase
MHGIVSSKTAGPLTSRDEYLSPTGPAGFGRFLAEQADLGPKQVPKYVRVVRELPRTSTFKVVKRHLSAEGVDCADPIWTRSDKDGGYTVLGRLDRSS